MSREIKFRGLVQDSPTAKPRWVYYGVGGKPYVLGRAEWLAEDLQYIGCEDRKGEEIYEGDIIQQYWRREAVPGRHAVEYWDHGFYLNDLGKTNFNAEDSEVIGNIYENKELLDA